MFYSTAYNSNKNKWSLKISFLIKKFLFFSFLGLSDDI